MNKEYFAKIYEPSVNGVQGDLIKIIKDFVYLGHKWTINGGLGETNLTFPRPINDFGEDNDIALFNQVDIYIIDKESLATGQLIYSGYIIDYTPILDDSERLEVTLWGYPTEWSKVVLEDGDDTTVPYLSQDPSVIMADVLDKSNTNIDYSLAPLLEEDFETDNITGGYLDTDKGIVEIQDGIYSQGSYIGSTDWIIDKVFSNSITQVVEIKHNCDLTNFQIMARKNVNPVDNFTCSIYECDINGIPTATLIAACLPITGASMSNNFGLVTFYPALTASFIQGQKVAFTFSRSGGSDLTNAYAIKFYYTNSIDYSIALFYEAFIPGVLPMAAHYKLNYDTEDNEVISNGYDTTYTNPEYQGYELDYTGSSVIITFSDSDNNVDWGSWVSDITTLTKRYVKFKITTLGSSIVKYVKFLFNGGSILRTFTEVSYTFKQNTIQECVDQLVKMSPAYWYWRVGADNMLVFDVRNPNQIEHRFIIGKDVESVRMTRSGKELYNTYYFLGGGDPQLYVKKQRKGSYESFGNRSYRSQDERVTNQDSSDIITSTLLDTNDHPNIIGEVTVVDSNGVGNGYDIESLKVGQMVTITNPNQDVQDSLWDVANWDENHWDFPLSAVLGTPFQIVSIDYTLDRAKLSLAYNAKDGAKRIQDIKINLEQSRTQNTPITPTNI